MTPEVGLLEHDADLVPVQLRDAVERSRIDDVDVVLMDLRFAGDATAGVRATATLRELAHPPQVLVLTSHDTDADILGAIEAGAWGYHLKDAGPDELLAAVHTPPSPARAHCPPPSPPGS